MLLNCTDCEREISKWARACPHCGKPQYRGFEWRSEAEVLGIPLIHITSGRDSITGRIKVSKGIIAIGQFGIGLFTVAQVGIGFFFGLGQVMFGLITIAQLSIALYFGIGQFATGMIAIGQLALGYYVLGQIGFGAHVLSAEMKDPAAIEYFTNIWNNIKSFLPF